MHSSPSSGSHPDQTFLPANSRLSEWENLSRYFQQLPVAVAVFQGPDHRYVFANAAFCRLTGLPADAWQGQLAAALPQGASPLLPLLQEVWTSGQQQEWNRYPFSFHQGNGAEEGYLHLIVQPLLDDAGKTEGLLLSAFDVTTQVAGQKKDEEKQLELASLANAMPQLVWMTDAAGEVTYYNERVSEFEGAHQDGQGHWTWTGLIHPDDQESTFAAWQQALATGSHYEKEHRIKIAGGGYRWFLSRGLPQYNSKGALVGWYGTATDIDAVKTAEERIKKSEEQFRQAFAHAAIGMALTNGEGRFVEVNKAYEDLLGYSQEELKGRHYSFITHPDDQQQNAEEVAQLLQNRDMGLVREKRYVRKDGEVVWVQLSLSVVHQENGAVQHFLSLAEDITREKKAREELEQSEQRFRSLAENTPDVITKHGRDYRYLYASPIIESYTGIPAADYIGKSYRELGMPETLCQFFDEQLRLVFTEKKGHTLEYQMPGDNRIVHSRMVPELDEQGEVTAVLILSTDITEIRKTDEALKYQKLLLETVTDNTDMALFLMNEQQECVYMNEAAEEMTGFTLQELQGKHLHDAIHHTRPDGRPYPLEECPIDQALPTHRRMRGEEMFVHKDGSFYPVAFTASPIVIDGKPTGTVVEVRNTTEERKKEQALRESEQRFRAIANEAPAFIFMANENAEVEFVSKSWMNFTGLNEAEATGQGWATVTHPDDLALNYETYNKGFRTRTPYQYETRQRSKEGKYHWILWRGVPRYLPSGEFLGILGIGIDITDRKEAEEAVRHSNERFELINRATQDAIWDWDLHSNRVLWNETVYSMFGYRNGEVDASSDWWYQNIHPEDRERVVQGIHAIIDAGGDSWVDEYRFRCAGGSYKTVLDRGFIMHDTKGQSVRMLGSMQDITQRKEIEATLRDNEERFRTLANSISQLAWIANAEGWIFWYNDRWYDYTGTTLEEMQGWGWQQVHHPAHIQRVVNFVQEAWQKDVPWELTFPLRSRSGEYRWFLTRAYPVKNSEGKVVQWIGTNTDIHDQKTLAEQLEKAVADRTRELQRSNDDLQQFAHVASHDLKEPVRKIKTFGSRLVSEFGDLLPEKARLYVDKMESAAGRMYSMIEGVLRYSTVGVSEQSDQQPVALSEVVAQVQSDLEVMIQQKDASIAVGPLPVVEGSQLLLHQLMYNLVVNALKFVRPGVQPQVRIQSAPLPEGAAQWQQLLPGRSYACITVADNGIGFDREDAGKIFKTFTRLHSKDRFEGTGLGLALCKKIVERHGGLISATGEEGVGATFEVVLPLSS